MEEIAMLALASAQRRPEIDGERLNFNSASKVGPEEGCGASGEMSQSFQRPGQDLGRRKMGKWFSGQNELRMSD